MAGGRLFQTRGPATANALSPSDVVVRGMSSIKLAAECVINGTVVWDGMVHKSDAYLGLQYDLTYALLIDMISNDFEGLCISLRKTVFITSTDQSPNMSKFFKFMKPMPNDAVMVDWLYCMYMAMFPQATPTGTKTCNKLIYSVALLCSR